MPRRIKETSVDVMQICDFHATLMVELCIDALITVCIKKIITFNVLKKTTETENKTNVLRKLFNKNLLFFRILLSSFSVVLCFF